MFAHMSGTQGPQLHPAVAREDLQSSAIAQSEHGGKSVDFSNIGCEAVHQSDHIEAAECELGKQHS